MSMTDHPDQPTAEAVAAPMTRSAFLAQPRKAVALFGMSGVGKTRLSEMLRATSAWYHYSVDYRIGTRYMGEYIVDLFKQEAMKSPLLRSLLMSDSIYIQSNMAFKNLSPLTAYIGLPGDPEKGGLLFDEYVRRQRQHRGAEIAAMLDSLDFIEKSRAIYGYPNFLCDTSGSLVEVVDPDNPEDAVMAALTPHILFVFIEGAAEDEDELCRRFEADPKPIYYDETFLRETWAAYLEETGDAPEKVDPYAFSAWAFRKLVSRRAPRYKAIADRWGVTISRSDVAEVQTEKDFLDLIASALPEQPA